MQRVTEVELVGEHLLGTLEPLVAYVCANEPGDKRFAAPCVRETAVLALCKLMSVSSVTCER
jgi:hypothetical protein